MEKLSLISVTQALACPAHHQLLQEQGMLSFSPLILMNQLPLLKWSAWFVQITTTGTTKKMPSYSHQISNYMPKSLGADYGQLSKKSNICEETQGFRKLLRSKIGSLFSNQSFKFCLHFTNFSHVQNTLRLGIFLLGLFLLWFVFPDLVWFLFQQLSITWQSKNATAFPSLATSKRR